MLLKFFINLLWLWSACVFLNVSAVEMQTVQMFKYGPEDENCSTALPGFEYVFTYLTGQACDMHYYESEPAQPEQANYSLIQTCDNQWQLYSYDGSGDECTGSPIFNPNLGHDIKSAWAGDCVPNYESGVIASHIKYATPLHAAVTTHFCSKCSGSSILGMNLGCSATTNTTTTTTTTVTAVSFTYRGQSFSYGQVFAFLGTSYSAGGDYYYYGVSTLITAHITPGTTVIPVASVAGFIVGHSVLIGQSEIKEIASITTSRRLSEEDEEDGSPGRRLSTSSLTLTSGVAMTHGSGTSISQVVSATAAGGGDPVAMFGGQRREFWLPTGVLHPILHMPELSMMASTFPGDDGEQWFDRIVILSPGGFSLADISIKDIATFNKTSSRKNAFETLDVRLGGAETPVEHMPTPDFLFQRMGVYITFMRMEEMKRPIAHQTRIQRARRDVVMVACGTAHLLITASPASEYSSFRPDLAVRYSHLDIVVLEMHNHRAMKGLLPELWGIKPLSNRTKAFMVPPETSMQNGKSDTPIDDDGKIRFLAKTPPASSWNESSDQDMEEDGELQGQHEVIHISIGENTTTRYENYSSIADLHKVGDYSAYREVVSGLKELDGCVTESGAKPVACVL